jgi:Holliday junction resolvase RusA-like endonuclease
LSNLIEAAQDVLVKAGVIEDDNYKYIKSLDGCRVEFDKKNPRTEIEIEEV